MEKEDISPEELKNLDFSDIEDIVVSITIKGKSYAIRAKKGHEDKAKIDRCTALYYMLDNHKIALPSIDETLNSLKEESK